MRPDLPAHQGRSRVTRCLTWTRSWTLEIPAVRLNHHQMTVAHPALARAHLVLPIADLHWIAPAMCSPSDYPDQSREAQHVGRPPTLGRSPPPRKYPVRCDYLGLSSVAQPLGRQPKLDRRPLPKEYSAVCYCLDQSQAGQHSDRHGSQSVPSVVDRQTSRPHQAYPMAHAIGALKTSPRGRYAQCSRSCL